MRIKEIIPLVGLCVGCAMLGGVITSLATAAIFPAQSDDLAEYRELFKPTYDPVIVCPDFHTLATHAMTMRQGGSPVGVTLERAPDNGLWREAVLDAYAHRLSATDEGKVDAVTRFASKYEVKCFQEARAQGVH